MLAFLQRKGASSSRALEVVGEALEALVGEALALAGEAVGEALEELVEVLQARNPSQRGILSHLRLGHARQIDSQ